MWMFRERGFTTYFSKLQQFWKEYSGIERSDDGKVSVVRLSQKIKALRPMDMTPSGIASVLMRWQYEKALSPIANPSAFFGNVNTCMFLHE